MTILTDIFSPNELMVLSALMFAIGCIGIGVCLGDLIFGND